MRRKIKWNTVFFWSMILVLAFLIWNQKTIIREGVEDCKCCKLGNCSNKVLTAKSLAAKAKMTAADKKWKAPFNQCGPLAAYTYISAQKAPKDGGKVTMTHSAVRKMCQKLTTKSGCRDKYVRGTGCKRGLSGEVKDCVGVYPCCWHEKGATGIGGKGVTRYGHNYGWDFPQHRGYGGGVCEPPVSELLQNKKKAAATATKKAATKAAPAETTKKATISPAKVKGKSGPIPKATTGTDKRGKTVKAAAGGGSGGIDVDYKKGAKWKIAVGKNSNSLEFNYDGKPMVSIGSDGQIRGKKCSCGKWNLRDNRMGIPGRNDINLHTDGWARMLKYDTGADLSSHTTADYKQGGFAGQKLYYLKGGKTGVALS